MKLTDEDAKVVAVVLGEIDESRVGVTMAVENVFEVLFDCKLMAEDTSPESDVDCVVDDNDVVVDNDDNGEDADVICDAGELVEDLTAPTRLDVEVGRLVTG